MYASVDADWMGVYCSKLSVFSEKLFIPIRFEILVTKFFQADVYAVESLFVCNVRTFIMFCSEHVVYKCVYLECSDVAHVYPCS